MLKLYQSNKVERLLAQLIKLLLERDVAPLEQDIIVVENPGLAHWLKMQLAHSLGIAANIEFPMPSRFLWQIQRNLMPDIANESVFTKASLTWLILEGLEDQALMQQDEFALLRHYLQGHDSDSENEQALRAYRLASTIADLYDQYLVHRPDWIEQWQAKTFEIDGKPLADQAWQGIFWHYLIEKVKSKGLSERHRANLVSDFLQELESTQKAQLPKRVIFFGFTSLPKQQVEAISLLASKVNVHLLTPNPCEYYWGDVVSETMQAKLRARKIELPMADAGNDLLASLGKLGQDFQRLLMEVGEIEDVPLFLESHATHALAHIQNQILKLQQPTSPIKIDDDNSLKVVGCHSPMREIEVLHDHLLDIFETTDLTAQDVVVMIPDVASYAPFIDAVFNAQPAHMRIPYSVSDRPLQAEHPILNGVQLLLSMPQSRMPFSDVITLLEIPAVYRQYELQETHLAPLKQWLVAAGVRWGFDGQTREGMGLPQWQQNTWLYGFKRLLMGYAAQSTQPILGIVPVENVEGLDAAILGPLIQFVNDLHHYAQASQQSRHCDEWSPFFSQWLQHFLQPNDEEQSIIEHVYETLENWVESVQAVHYSQTIPYEIFSDSIKQGLQKSNGSQHFMVGKVNFCTLLPMRSIPFKMVAVLGLNDSEYPRSVIPNSLDLMSKQHRLGDRSRRNEDRYLFLEAILSAREFLWLSYRSKSQQNDEPLTPSVVLAEFLDYIHQGDSPLDLVQQHPLQPFNPQYYNDASDLFSFNQDWLSAIESSAPALHHTNNTIQLPSKTDPQDDILLEQLIRFYQHPTKYYLNQVLNINLHQYFDELIDHEPFILDGLEQFKIKQSILNDVVHKTGNSLAKTEGLLAFGEIGQQHLQGLQQQLEPMIHQYHDYQSHSPISPIEINVGFSAGLPRLFGWQYQIFDQYHIVLVPSGFKAKHLIALLIEQASLSAMGLQKHSRLICQDQIVQVKPMAMQIAKDYLQQLVEVFIKGQSQPLPLLIETAWQLKAPISSRSKKTPEDLAFEKFIGSQGSSAWGYAGERDDIHVQRCIEDLNEIPAQTLQLSHSLFDVWLNNELIEMEALS
ncbi:exodeoxyribonuclease V subunit gamma [Oceaniserpentilla sp. 4NH20-0058]|uniref:exodeoxyribonuclease V subunit gamma n=1 Tax=Oceaniserpentilla sp. 4NH20-0058 TaxID=3127660 RepID=UPI0031022663